MGKLLLERGEDELKRRSQEYSAPVLGLIFLRFAEVRLAAQRAKLEKASASARRGSRVDEPAAYHAEGILYLPAEARFDDLLSRDAFPKNTYPPSQWPIPFFGNPKNALVATVGVNPSSDEFAAERLWPEASERNRKDWKLRLKNYFNSTPPAHDWFDPWRVGLELIGVSYESGTAAHAESPTPSSGSAWV